MPDPLKSLSDELRDLAAAFAEREVTLGDIITRLGARASGLTIIILALPFCAPISIPGLSVPFGTVIAFLAARWSLGLPPWLPKKLLATRLPPTFFGSVLSGAGKLLGRIERRLRPRWLWLTSTPARQRFHGWSVFFAALLLLLPLGGIPFTNTLPALAIVIGTLGLLERDGLAVLLGHSFLVATLIYFATFGALFIELLKKALHWLTG